MSGEPIIAGQDPDPLPSELLHPSGIAAWVIRPEDLDRLGVLTTDPHTSTPERLSALSAGRPQQQERPRSRIARAVRDDPPNAQLLSDPHRPHPQADAWPDDAVLVTYRELRALIALHLDVCGQTMPSVEPWAFARMRAQAMREGETPLLLSEVLDR